MESKKEIYDLLPPGSYPKTILLHPDQYVETDIESYLDEYQLHFPLIAKPDIGMRGMAVKLLNNKSDWESYHRNSRVSYLLQEYISYTNEVGIFYYRLPNKVNGKITGIVEKQLLKVIGNGHSTIKELINNNDRFMLQLPILETSMPNQMIEILKTGEERILVPYGNHCRGAKFIDKTSDLTPALYNIMNDICKNVPGFYFGRLDIRFESWEKLCEGNNFSIIELNGAGSEPAHIYDPAHSVWYGWREIIKHWKILYQVSMINKSKHHLSYLSFQEGMKMLKDNKKHMKLIS